MTVWIKHIYEDTIIILIVQIIVDLINISDVRSKCLTCWPKSILVWSINCFEILRLVFLRFTCRIGPRILSNCFEVALIFKNDMRVPLLFLFSHPILTIFWLFSLCRNLIKLLNWAIFFCFMRNAIRIYLSTRLVFFGPVFLMFIFKLEPILFFMKKCGLFVISLFKTVHLPQLLHLLSTFLPNFACFSIEIRLKKVQIMFSISRAAICDYFGLGIIGS